MAGPFGRRGWSAGFTGGRMGDSPIFGLSKCPFLKRANPADGPPMPAAGSMYVMGPGRGKASVLVLRGSAAPRRFAQRAVSSYGGGFEGGEGGTSAAAISAGLR